MASTYHFSSQPVQAGCSASAHYDYVSREGKYSPERTGEDDLITEDYGNMPDWAAGKPGTFFDAADRFGRMNGRSYREINVALQNELSLEDNTQLVREFIRESGIEDNHAYYFSIHSRLSSDNKNTNIHAHIMFNEKVIERDRPLDRYHYFRNYAENANGEPTSGYRTSKRHSSREGILSDRQLWENIVNRKFRERDIDERVSAKTLAAQRAELLAEGRNEEAELLNRTPSPHIGPILRREECKERLRERIRQFEAEVAGEERPAEEEKETSRTEDAVQEVTPIVIQDTEPDDKKKKRTKPTTTREELESIENQTERLIAIYAHDYVIRQTAKQIQKERLAEHKKAVEERADIVEQADLSVTVGDITNALRIRKDENAQKMLELRKKYTAAKGKIVPEEHIRHAAYNRLSNNEYDRLRKRRDSLEKQLKAIEAEAKIKFPEYYSRDSQYFDDHPNEMARLGKQVNDWIAKRQWPLTVEQTKADERIETIEDFRYRRKQEFTDAMDAVRTDNEAVNKELKALGKEYGKLKREGEKIDTLQDNLSALDADRTLFAAKVGRILTTRDKIHGTTPVRTLEKMEVDGQQYYILDTHGGGKQGGYQSAVRLHDDVAHGSVPVYYICYEQDGSLRDVMTTEERAPLYTGKSATKDESFKPLPADPHQSPPVNAALKHKTVQAAAMAVKAVSGLLDNKAGRNAGANKRTKIRFRKDDTNLSDVERMLRQYFSEEADVTDDLPDTHTRQDGLRELMAQLTARHGGSAARRKPVSVIHKTQEGPAKTTVNTRHTTTKRGPRE